MKFEFQTHSEHSCSTRPEPGLPAGCRFPLYVGTLPLAGVSNPGVQTLWALYPEEEDSLTPSVARVCGTPRGWPVVLVTSESLTELTRAEENPAALPPPWIVVLAGSQLSLLRDSTVGGKFPGEKRGACGPRHSSHPSSFLGPALLLAASTCLPPAPCPRPGSVDSGTRRSGGQESCVLRALPRPCSQLISPLTPAHSLRAWARGCWGASAGDFLAQLAP